jgi:bacteriocin biosynthesis cyclodehydratase domain-containing protein
MDRSMTAISRTTRIHDDRRLRLRPVVRFVPLDDQRWGVWIGTLGSQLQGRDVARFVADLIELLDGEHTAGEIVRVLGERRGVAAPLVRDLLARFYDWLIVDDDEGYRSGPEDGDLGPFLAQVRYLALATSSPVSAQRRLHSARVAVFGMDGIGEHVALALAGAGVAQLVLRGGEVVPEDRGAFHYGPADVGRPAAQALADVLTRLRPEVRASLADDALPDVDLVVLATRDLHGAEAARVNQACVDAGRPLLLVGIDMVQGFVGPLVLPRESPCLACTVARLGQSESELVGRLRPRPAHVEPTPFAAILGNLAALEAIKVLSQTATPTVLSAQLQLDARSLSMTTVDLVRHPRCRVCGPLVARAPRVVFDVATAQEDGDAA